MKRIEINKSLFDEQHEVWQTHLRHHDQQDPNIFLWRYDVCDFLNMSSPCDLYQEMIYNALNQFDFVNKDNLKPL